jgi:hypothetical protein
MIDEEVEQLQLYGDSRIDPGVDGTRCPHLKSTRLSQFNSVIKFIVRHATHREVVHIENLAQLSKPFGCSIHPSKDVVSIRPLGFHLFTPDSARAGSIDTRLARYYRLDRVGIFCFYLAHLPSPYRATHCHTGRGVRITLCCYLVNATGCRTWNMTCHISHR